MVRVTGVTIAYCSEHGDPYVFPAGVAEQEHVPKRQFPQPDELEFPIPEYEQPGQAEARGQALTCQGESPGPESSP